MEITDELRVLVTAEVDKAVQNLNSLDKKTEKTKNSFEELGKAMGAALLARAVINFGKESAEAYSKSQQTLSVLNSTLKATGAETWTSSQQLQNMAKSLQDVTNYSDDSVMSMQSVLLGFKNIKGDNFEQATKAILDMSTVMKMDLGSAAQTVGKALDDPVNGLDSLKRQGFAFTDQQKSQLKAMVAVGDYAGAQNVILKELATTYGGAAAAAQDGLAKAKNDMEDVSKSIGSILLPEVQSIASEAAKFLKYMSETDAGTKRFIVTAAGLLALAPAAIIGINAMNTALIALSANPAFAVIGVATIALAAGTTALLNYKNAWGDLTTQITSNKNQSDALLKSYAQNNDKKKLDEKTTEDLIKIYPELRGQIKAYTTTVEEASKAVENLVNQKLLDAESSGIKRYLSDLNGIADQQIHVNKLKSSGNSMDAAAAKEQEAQLEAMKNLAETDRKYVNDKIKSLGKMLEYDGRIINIPVEPVVGENGANTESGKKTWQEWFKSITKLPESVVIKTGNDASKQYLSALEAPITADHRVSDLLYQKFDVSGELKKEQSSMQKTLTEMFAIDPSKINLPFEEQDQVVQNLITEYQNLGQEIKRAEGQKEVVSYIGDLRNQVNTFGKSEDDLAISTALANGATADQITMIIDLQHQLKQSEAAASGWEAVMTLAIEDQLNDWDKFDEKTNKVIAKLGADLASLSFDSAISGLTSLGEAFGEGKNASESLSAALADMSQKILDQLPTLFLQAGLQLIADGQWAIGLGFVGAAASSAVIDGYVKGKTSDTSSSDTEADALGGAYGTSGRIAFAKGGTFTNAIVSDPTFFRFASGGGFGNGVMGEAGPEAVMPLTRGSDGSLGVSLYGDDGSGSQEASFVINIYNNSGEEVSSSTTTDANGNKSVDVVIGVMNQAVAAGRLDKTIGGRFGLKVRGV